MPKNNDRNTQDFSKYDAMTSEELAQLLRLDSEAPEGNELDIDTWFYITGVLAERKKISNNTGKTAQEAWNLFQQDYLPVEDDVVFPAKASKPAKTHPWVRRAIAAAAAVALIVCIPLTAKALNWEKIWNTVAMWAKETFSFVREDQPDADEPEQSNDKQYESLQQAMESTDQESYMIPTWIPDGFVLDHVDIDETPTQRNYVAIYKNGERSINICVRSYTVADPERIEINEELIEIYNWENTEYYIFSNNKRFRAVWTKDSYECYISGEITIEEMKKMIDSIPKG